MTPDSKWAMAIQIGEEEEDLDVGGHKAVIRVDYTLYLQSGASYLPQGFVMFFHVSCEGVPGQLVASPESQSIRHFSFLPSYKNDNTPTSLACLRGHL